MKRMHEIKYDGDSVSSIDGKSVGGGNSLLIITGENVGGWDGVNPQPIDDTDVIAKLELAAQGAPAYFKGSIAVQGPEDEEYIISTYGFLLYNSSDSRLYIAYPSSYEGYAYFYKDDDDWYVAGSDGF